MSNSKFLKVLVRPNIHLSPDGDALSQWFSAHDINPMFVRLDTVEVDTARRQIRFDAYRFAEDGSVERDLAGQPVIERVTWEGDPQPLPDLLVTEVVEVDDDPS